MDIDVGHMHVRCGAVAVVSLGHRTVAVTACGGSRLFRRRPVVIDRQKRPAKCTAKAGGSNVRQVSTTSFQRRLNAISQVGLQHARY